MRQNQSARSRLREWAASSSWATATIAGAAAVLAALIKQFVALFGPDGWDWLDLLEDLITNVFLATIVTVLVEYSRRLSALRATENFVLQTQPMIRDAVLSWAPSGTDDEPWGNDDTATQRLMLAKWTLSEVSSALTIGAELGTPPPGTKRTRLRRESVWPGRAVVDLGGTAVRREPPVLSEPRRVDLKSAVMHLGLYVDNGGRARRAIYARALITVLGRARSSGGPHLADAATDFVRDAERWLGLIERFNGAFAAWLSTSGAAHPETAAARATGQDPMVVACRWLRKAARRAGAGDRRSRLRHEGDALGTARRDPRRRDLRQRSRGVARSRRPAK